MSVLSCHVGPRDQKSVIGFGVGLYLLRHLVDPGGIYFIYLFFKT